jgi:hypothetical protein
MNKARELCCIACHANDDFELPSGGHTKKSIDDKTRYETCAGINFLYVKYG